MLTSIMSSSSADRSPAGERYATNVLTLATEAQGLAAELHFACLWLTPSEAQQGLAKTLSARWATPKQGCYAEAWTPLLPMGWPKSE